MLMAPPGADAQSQSRVPAAPDEVGHVQVETNGDLMTVRARDARIETIIRRIAGHAGLPVISAELPDERMTIEIDQQLLFLDGVYVELPDGSMRFRWGKAPSRAELT